MPGRISRQASRMKAKGGSNMFATNGRVDVTIDPAITGKLEQQHARGRLLAIDAAFIFAAGLTAALLQAAGSFGRFTLRQSKRLVEHAAAVGPQTITCSLEAGLQSDGRGTVIGLTIVARECWADRARRCPTS
jgi:hypothetical protein